jgi:hypothetical protein
MIYISVDNDHHGGLAISLIKKYGFPADEIMFISHISRRNNTIPTSKYLSHVIVGHPLSGGSGYKTPMTYIRSYFHQRRLNQAFQFKPDDTLVIITEYQINNALLARSMKRAGGTVLLFDEGIGFYFNNSPFQNKRITALNALYLRIYNLVFRVLDIPVIAKKGFEGRMHVRIRDTLIDRIYSRMRLPIDRSCVIRGYRNLLASEAASEAKMRDTAIFFANNLTCFGVQDQEIKLSQDALRLMAARFSKVYLKIHPADVAEKNDIFRFYTDLAQKFSNVQIVEAGLTANDAIEQLRPGVVVGSLGASMFDAFFFGCQPVFLFHLLPPVEEFEVCKFTLDGIRYNYIGSLDDISPDYNCGVNVGALLYEDEEPWWKTITSDSRNGLPAATMPDTETCKAANR